MDTVSTGRPTQSMFKSWTMGCCADRIFPDAVLKTALAADGRFCGLALCLNCFWPLWAWLYHIVPAQTTNIFLLAKKALQPEPESWFPVSRSESDPIRLIGLRVCSDSGRLDTKMGNRRSGLLARGDGAARCRPVRAPRGTPSPGAVGTRQARGHHPSSRAGPGPPHLPGMQPISSRG